MNGDEYLENFGSPSMAVGEYGTPLHAQICYNCNRHVRGQFNTNDLLLPVCASCTAASQSASSVSMQRPVDEDGDESGHAHGRLEFGDDPVGSAFIDTVLNGDAGPGRAVDEPVAESQGSQVVGLQLKCYDCGGHGATYFSEYEMQYGKAFCLQCKLDNYVDYEKEDLPDSDSEDLSSP